MQRTWTQGHSPIARENTRRACLEPIDVLGTERDRRDETSADACRVQRRSVILSPAHAVRDVAGRRPRADGVYDVLCGLFSSGDAEDFGASDRGPLRVDVTAVKSHSG